MFPSVDKPVFLFQFACAEIKFLSNGRYIPDASNALYDVLREMAESHASKKQRYKGEDAELLEKVSAHLITKETLRQKLAQHVEKVSYT